MPSVVRCGAFYVSTEVRGLLTAGGFFLFRPQKFSGFGSNGSAVRPRPACICSGTLQIPGVPARVPRCRHRWRVERSVRR